MGSERDAVDGAAVAGAQSPDQMVALHVPQADRPIVAISGGESPTVGTVGNAVDKMMGLQRHSEPAAVLHRPQHDGSPDVTGREAAPIGTEHEAGDGAGMIVELSKQSVAVHVPQLDRPVGARSREYASVRAERDAVDRAGVRPQRRSELPAAWRVPQTNCATSASSRNRASIWAERDTIDDADEAPERPDQAVAAQVPQLNRPVFGGGGEGVPVGTERDAADWAGVTDQSCPGARKAPAG